MSMPLHRGRALGCSTSTANPLSVLHTACKEALLQAGLSFPIIKQLWSDEASVRDAATLLAPLLGDQDDKVIEPLIQA